MRHRRTMRWWPFAPAIVGGFELERGPPPEVVVTVGEREFDAAYLQSLRELGQGTRISNPAKGYWLGVAIDPKTGATCGHHARVSAACGRGRWLLMGP